MVWPTGNLFAGDFRDLHYAFAGNLYWRADGGEIRFGEWTFAQWQARGMDQGSRITAPGFVDPAHDDYRLTEQSPARALGIESVDVRGAGPRPRK